jgi:hypothetical protein
LLLAMEEGCFHAREPCWEKSNEMWWLVMERFSLMVIKNLIWA